jgi:hypothetical protein
MRPGLLRLLLAATLAASAHSALGAQEVPVRKLPRPTVSCGGPFAMILIKVVDAQGAPVADATVDVRRVRDSAHVREGGADLASMGEYVVMDDSALPLVSASGERFLVRARRAGKRSSAVLRVGRSTDGCHVQRISGAQQLMLPG